MTNPRTPIFYIFSALAFSFKFRKFSSPNWIACRTWYLWVILLGNRSQKPSLFGTGNDFVTHVSFDFSWLPSLFLPMRTDGFCKCFFFNFRKFSIHVNLIRKKERVVTKQFNDICSHEHSSFIRKMHCGLLLFCLAQKCFSVSLSSF